MQTNQLDYSCFADSRDYQHEEDSIKDIISRRIAIITAVIAIPVTKTK